MKTIDVTQVDSTVFSSIALASQQTADNTTLGSYDYMTITIAVIACVVSLISLYIAKRTLDSQVQTERNTRSISVDNLVKMLMKLLSKAYVSLVRSSVLKTKWSETGYEGCPHNDIIGYMKFPVNYIQAEVCAVLKEPQYIALLELKCLLADYNERLERRFTSFYNKETPALIKIRDINRLEMESCWTIKRIIEVINIVSGTDMTKESLETIQNTSSAFNDDISDKDLTIEIPIPECVQIIDSFTDEDFALFKKMIENNLKVFYGHNKRGEDYICIITPEKRL